MEGGREAKMEIRDKETSETETSLRARMGQYSWYHCIEVLPGIETPGIEEFRPIQIPVIEALRELPLAGGRVLEKLSVSTIISPKEQSSSCYPRLDRASGWSR